MGSVITPEASGSTVVVVCPLRCLEVVITTISAGLVHDPQALAAERSSSDPLNKTASGILVVGRR